ncbi:MAG: RHS repeat domain-containing protein, partial [Pyrinomonadaceae bacterium]
MLVDTWTAALDSGTSRAVVRAGFADGVEFSNRVSGMYPGPAPGAATPLMLANAGFETPSLGLGHLYNPQNASWIFAGAAGVSYNNSGFTSGNPNAPQGAQVGFLQLTGTISQQVSGFQAGVGYTVKFKAAQRGNQTQAGQEVEVLLDDQSLGVFRPAGTSYSAHQTVSFVATAGAHTLRFVGRNPAGGDNTAFIDDVRVEGMAGGGGGGPVPRDGHAYLSFDPTTNRINSAGWLYDAAGNQTRVQTAGGGWLRHEYDAANRLVRVKADDNTTVIAAYTYG